MTFDIDQDEYVFASGKRAYANRGIIGLSPRLNIYGGYDHALGLANDHLLASDKIELATHMIEQWTRFRKLAEEGKL